MLNMIRQEITAKLWANYRVASLQMQQLEKSLKQKNIDTIPLDHFAVIDLPGPHSGIPVLHELFAILGYDKQGQDYLPDKQNDFLWLAEADSKHQPVQQPLPQIVIADFRMDELPAAIQSIIAKYAYLAKPAPLVHLKTLIERSQSGDHTALHQAIMLVVDYLQGRDWPLPLANEFHTVHEFNELLAWVLIFGRRPNHFTVSAHLLNSFTDMTDFQHFISNHSHLPLNQEGGVIKGGKHMGIAQGATMGMLETVALADGTIQLPTGFVEFVWRYPLDPHGNTPLKWGDYFTGFIAKQANHVIESLSPAT